MTPDHYFMRFVVGDWLKDPAVTRLSPAARGIWWDLVCAMFEDDQSGVVKGSIEALARLGRCSVSEMESAISEFETYRNCDVSRNGHGFVTLKNRRMFQEAKTRIDAAKRQRKRRKLGSAQPPVTPPSQKCHADNDTLEIRSYIQERKRNETKEESPLGGNPVKGEKQFASNRIDIAQMDVDLAVQLARRLIRQLPFPKADEKQRAADESAYWRLAILASTRFSENWLVDAIEAVKANKSHKSKVAHLQGVLKSKLQKSGVDLKSEMRRVQVPDNFREWVYDTGD